MAKPIILLVEYLDENATLVRKVLNARGHDVLWADTGDKGLAMAHENLPKLILIDLGFPDIDGQKLVRQFRNIPELKDVPILFFTDWPEEIAQKLVTEYGCNGYIRKPVDIRLLSDTINNYFLTG